MTANVLLTGGFGNIGGRFASFLADKSVTRCKLGSRKNRRVPTWAPDAEAIRCDLTDIRSLRDACEGVGTIFHFAALNDRECASDPSWAHKVNVIGTENLAQAAESCGVEHLIYISTIHVYGAPLKDEITENSPTIPTHPYGQTHLEAERLLEARSGRLKTTIVRCGNGFGFPMTRDVDVWHTFVNELCTQAVKHREMIIKSPSNSERNFVTLQDFCRAFYYLGFELGRPTDSLTVNLGSVQSRTLYEMAELIAERTEVVLGFRPRIVEQVPPSTDSSSLNFNSSKLRNMGFTTEERFEFEIDGIINFLKTANEQ
jgi:UDP-glucose 4-epimerase